MIANQHSLGSSLPNVQKGTDKKKKKKIPHIEKNEKRRGKN